MKVHYKIIPHERQRYDTCGDYFFKRGIWHFRVSRMPDKRFCLLIWMHELIEWSVCQYRGIKEPDIARFDIAYEKSRGVDRAPCGCRYYEEPGDDPCAPYHNAHKTATACEELIALSLGVDWEQYEKAVEGL